MTIMLKEEIMSGLELAFVRHICQGNNWTRLKVKSVARNKRIDINQT